MEIMAEVPRRRLGLSQTTSRSVLSPVGARYRGPQRPFTRYGPGTLQKDFRMTAIAGNRDLPLVTPGAGRNQQAAACEATVVYLAEYFFFLRTLIVVGAEVPRLPDWRT